MRLRFCFGMLFLFLSLNLQAEEATIKRKLELLKCKRIDEIEMTPEKGKVKQKIILCASSQLVQIWEFTEMSAEPRKIISGNVSAHIKYIDAQGDYSTLSYLKLFKKNRMEFGYGNDESQPICLFRWDRGKGKYLSDCAR